MLAPTLAKVHDDSNAADERTYLRERMARPQRHRLLHGYPLAAAMPRRGEGPIADVFFHRAAGRGLLVGVLPHPFCNPAVAGCGFCTFPHQHYNAGRAAEVVEHVIQEIDSRLGRQPWLHRRRVDALYFGGGTANLTPAEPFRRLCRRLAEAFDLSEAEVTLEGVPAYFVKRTPLLMDVLREEMPARHFRVSMGIQTFDEERLRQMGRLAFGTAETFAQVVELAHARGFTASADLLFNLPWQTLDEMGHDLAQAVAIGLDHVGLYHLVLFRGLGTVWSRDPKMVLGLPSNTVAAENWLALREQLLNGGFVQTTLTNFERDCFRDDPRRFVYEEFSFQPFRYDMLGFGPGAISFTSDRTARSGLKVLNPEGAANYIAAVHAGGPAWDRYFDYDSADLRVFYLTRRLAALAIDRRDYVRVFGHVAETDFGAALETLLDEGLLEAKLGAFRPTPRGMFYADSIAALIAWRQIQAHREVLDAGVREFNDNGHAHM
jgi:oxygen-independent coproporphyrinogen-3 oxidase